MSLYFDEEEEKEMKLVLSKMAKVFSEMPEVLSKKENTTLDKEENK